MADPPSAPTFLGIPKEILNKILVDTNVIAIQSLRKTSKSLREFVGEKPFQFNDTTENIDFKVSANEISMSIDCEDEDEEEDSVYVVYEQKENGCSVFKALNAHQEVDESEKKFLKNVDIFGVAYNDLESILRAQVGRVSTFIIEFNPIGCEEKRQKSVVVQQKLVDYLKSRHGLMAVNELRVTAATQEEIIKIMGCFKAEGLQTLNISNGNQEATNPDQLFDISQIILSEHFQRASEVCMDDFLVNVPMQVFLHLQVVDITVDTVNHHDLHIVKESFRRSACKNRKFCIKFNQFENEPTASQMLGEFSDNPYVRTWFYIVLESELIAHMEIPHFNKGRRFVRFLYTKYSPFIHSRLNY